ncbi:MAG TPA: hypothetical protein V6D07_08795 [Trichocoleus sp.]
MRWWPLSIWNTTLDRANSIPQLASYREHPVPTLLHRAGIARSKYSLLRSHLPTCKPFFGLELEIPLNSS